MQHQLVVAMPAAAAVAVAAAAAGAATGARLFSGCAFGFPAPPNNHKTNFLVTQNVQFNER